MATLSVVQVDEQKKGNRFFVLGEIFGNRYLTKREVEVLKYVVLGHTAKKIGKSLNISFRTVESYIETLKMKLNCASKNDISEVVIRSGLFFKLGVV